MTPAHAEIDLDRLQHDVSSMLRAMLTSNRSPSAWELVEEVEKTLGWRAKWAISYLLREFVQDLSFTRSTREYMGALLDSEELERALAGEAPPRKEIHTGIDSLVQQSLAYRDSGAFQEMINFIGRFRDYAPYNNMLVRVQNPSCAFYATQGDWLRRFERRLKEDARPMLILAPMHPVLLVYEIDQTEGPDLPEHMLNFAAFTGDWDDDYLNRSLENAARRDHIRVDFKRLSSSNAGFATIARADREFKMRIALHEELDNPSRFGVLCHELAHIYLGHLGTDKDYWWPSRKNLDHRTVEIEAEAVAFLVTTRLGLRGASAAYVSKFVANGDIPKSVSLDLIAKVTSRIEDMARHRLETRRPRHQKAEQGRLQ